MVNELLEIEVTKGLLHVLSGCASVDVGQRVWMKIAPARGERVALEASEVKFIRTWVDESIKVAQGMADDCVGHKDPDCEIVLSELRQLRAVRDLLPKARRAPRSRWASVARARA